MVMTVVSIRACSVVVVVVVVLLQHWWVFLFMNATAVS